MTIKPTLVILAAGMGSRYGGLKQLDEIGPFGEAIIDYSLYDAIKAGFGKVVFIIRTDFAEEFKARFEPRLAGRIQTGYVYQSIDTIPQGFSRNPNRVKPWGTSHALMMAEGAVNEPMAVINADDFYGRVAYETMSQFLQDSQDPNEYAMVGYRVASTLSEFGSVSRGVCNTDANGYLTTVVERTKIVRESDGIHYYEQENRHTLSDDTPVSMNFWGLKPTVFGQLNEGFTEFLQSRGDDLTAEYYIPALINDNIQKQRIKTKVLTCNAPWFGVTYREDKPEAEKQVRRFIDQGIYPENLWL